MWPDLSKLEAFIERDDVSTIAAFIGIVAMFVLFAGAWLQ